MKMIAGLLMAASLCSAQGLSNRRAPSWNLPDSNLKHYDLLDYRGKWLVLDFMITQCPHCKTLSGILEKVQAKYGDAKTGAAKLAFRSARNSTASR